ncbi:hypothetical protein ACH5RR_036255 [Cinchona calisaya]|uniref:Uncharacterized protein n=1 Tax=Cinchona calisaya TaxID=153742 RepID=A0ABD2Y511_9GENT
MEAKIDAKIARIENQIQSVESELLQFQERLVHYQVPPPLDPSEPDGAMKWVTNRICELDEKKQALLAEKQELEELKVHAQNEDLQYIVESSRHRF